MLTGLVVDADTGKPIPAAFVGVLKPGVTADQFFGAPDGELIVARGVSGASGLYRTAPAIARGQAYSIVVGADGYEARGFDDVRLPADAPEVIELGDVALRRL